MLEYRQTFQDERSQKKNSPCQILNHIYTWYSVGVLVRGRILHTNSGWSWRDAGGASYRSRHVRRSGVAVNILFYLLHCIDLCKYILQYSYT